MFVFGLALTAGHAQGPGEILVAAAADLARAQVRIGDSFQKATGFRARFVLGSSGMLTRQIENGAPYDVFLSANESFIRDLNAGGRLDPATIAVYAQGRIAIWSRSGNLRTLADLAAPAIHHVAIANPQHAPYGVAAKEALINQGLWEKLAGRIVYGENVQQTLQYAESGNAEAAITAWSLVFDKGGILLPANLHAPIRQVGAVVKGTRNPQAAAAFVRFLTGPQGRGVLKSFGFN